MQDFEKLGVFYLGREASGPDGTDGGLVLYDSRDLTTHAVIVGMTGSGKTGLGIGLLEEAAIDGVPAIAIDPKGDLANLLLSFPSLRAEDFRPWIDEGAAARKGLTPDALADATARAWREGLAKWGQDGERIRRYREAADVAVYTPGNTSVRPLQVLRSLDAPAPALAADSTALRERIQSTVSGLLGLLGIDADPVQSREHILLSTILDTAWRAGRGLDLPALIREIQKPPFDAVGVFDLETFFPAKERLGLAMSLNNLVASPGFSAWMEGEPLDVRRLLYTPEGKPEPSLATEWKIAPDKTSVTLKLRSGVTFHSGTPFKADSVLATLQKGADPKRGKNVFSTMSIVKDWSAPDDSTVTINFKAPVPERQILDLLQFLIPIEAKGIDTVETVPAGR